MESRIKRVASENLKQFGEFILQLARQYANVFQEIPS